MLLLQGGGRIAKPDSWTWSLNLGLGGEGVPTKQPQAWHGSLTKWVCEVPSSAHLFWRLSCLTRGHIKFIPLQE